MDFTASNKIRTEKDFNKIALEEYKLLYRQDGEAIFKEMIEEKGFNHAESIVVRDFCAGIVIHGAKERFSVHRTSYYHIARELHDKLKIEKTFDVNLKDIIKRNKLNLNEVDALFVFIASILNLAHVMASIKAQMVEQEKEKGKNEAV